MTDYCVSNRYKMSMFIVWILVYLVAIGWIISLIYDEIRKRGWSLNLRMTVFICSLVGYIGELLSQFLFLFSVQSSGKYIIFAIAPTTVAITYYFATRAWFSTVINSNMEIDKNNIRWIFYCMATTGVFIPTIYITVCYVVGPIVSIETGHLEYLNIFYLTRLSGSYMSGLNTAVMLTFIGHRFIDLYAPVLESDIAADPEMTKLISNLKYVMGTARPNLIIQPILVLIPFWLFGGAHGVSYFQFTVNELFMLLATTMMSVALNKRASIFGLSSHETNSFISVRQGSFAVAAGTTSAADVAGSDSSRNVELIIASLQTPHVSAITPASEANV